MDLISLKKHTESNSQVRFALFWTNVRHNLAFVIGEADFCSIHIVIKVSIEKYQYKNKNFQNCLWFKEVFFKFYLIDLASSNHGLNVILILLQLFKFTWFEISALASLFPYELLIFAVNFLLIYLIVFNCNFIKVKYLLECLIYTRSFFSWLK